MQLQLMTKRDRRRGEGVEEEEKGAQETMPVFSQRKALCRSRAKDTVRNTKRY